MKLNLKRLKMTAQIDDTETREAVKRLISALNIEAKNHSPYRMLLYLNLMFLMSIQEMLLMQGKSEAEATQTTVEAINQFISDMKASLALSINFSLQAKNYPGGH